MANAVRSRFDTQIGTGQSVKVLYDNEAEIDASLPTAAQFVRLTLQPGIQDQLELGSPRTFRTNGRAVASIHAPLAIGDGAAITLADAVADAFRAVEADGVTYRTPSLTPVRRQGAWWVVSVEIPFYVEAIV